MNTAQNKNDAKEFTKDYHEKVVSYFDDVAAIYGVKHGADMPGGKYSFGTLYREILAPHFKPGMKVLELGCGNGASSEMLASFGVELTATDISEEMLKVAAARKIPSTKLRCVDAMALDQVKDLGTFDVIIAFNSFSYYPDKPKVLRDLKNFLKPNGELVLLDMNALSPIYPVLAAVGKNEMREWWKIIKEMTPSRLRHELTVAGYEIQDMRTLNFVPHATQGTAFQFLKTLNPVLNSLPGINKMAMRVLVRAKNKTVVA